MATLGFVAIWFVLFRPASLGGATSYVIVSGRSMEPTLRSGDLAIVREQASYDVGDLIAFRAEGGEVIHRIVGGNANDGFVVQGDNNPSPDLWRPKPDEIVGTRWFSVPEGGRWLVFFRHPTNFAILMATLAVLVLLGSGQMKHQRPKETSSSPSEQ